MGGINRGKRGSAPCQLELFSRPEALAAEVERYWRKRLRVEREELELAVERVVRRRVVAAATVTGSGNDE